MDAKLPKIFLIASTGWLLLKKLTCLNLYRKNTAKNREIVSSCPSLQKKIFIPTPYL